MKQKANRMKEIASMKRRNLRSFICLLTLALVGNFAISSAEEEIATVAKPKPDTKKSVKGLQDEFLKMKLGMFICYNMATFKEVEWVAGYPDPSVFNPGGKIDTDAWADAAVSAGMKYGVLTVKHVSGFCLWDSKYTTYDVMHPDCPYKQDLVAQYIKSFKSRGLKVGLYYCWRHPLFDKTKRGKGAYKVLPPECNSATHSFAEQIEFQKKQIAELFDKYPDVFYIWNDALDPDIMSADEAVAFLRKVRPGVTVSANWGTWRKKGQPYADIAVTERMHFKEGNTIPGETCWCLEIDWFRKGGRNKNAKDVWFWKTGSRAKNAKDMVREIRKANSLNANFLLNVGPDKQGDIVESSIKALAEIGKLMKGSGE